MNCGNLPGTGGPAGWLLLAALGLITVGLLLYVRRGNRTTATILVVMIAAGLTATTPAPVHAANSGCSDADQALVITQTSVMEDLGPTNPPADIIGRVSNPSLDSTYVSTVTVTIGSVAKASGAARGSCSATDFKITNPHMVVDEPLPARSHVEFSGAAIAFASSSSNQDACKRATIHLRYVSDSR